MGAMVKGVVRAAAATGVKPGVTTVVV